MFSKEELLSGLDTQVFGQKIYTYNSIDSTNSCAKVIANNGAKEGAIVIAEYQTEGRGRQGRTWQSEPGLNLLFSLVIRPSLEINSVGLLPFFAAAGVAIAVEGYLGIRCECKWPNDVLLNGKKFCGILMESSFQNNMLDYAVIGIGLNVNQKKFGPDIGKKATSLGVELKRDLDRKTIFQLVIRSLESIYADVRSGKFENVLKEWKARASIFGREIVLIQAGNKIEGKAVSLMEDGGLVILTSEGNKVFYSGDIDVTG
jgi:BirA family biotin operon repressor/biotin-[acetyl-CoA-carboxylase] ligase